MFLFSYLSFKLLHLTPVVILVKYFSCYDCVFSASQHHICYVYLALTGYMFFYFIVLVCYNPTTG